jgi:hypothetical protein
MVHVLGMGVGSGKGRVCVGRGIIRSVIEATIVEIMSICIVSCCVVLADILIIAET